MIRDEQITVEIVTTPTSTDVRLPPDLVSPDDFGHFIEHADFTNAWRDRGFTDEDLRYVQAIALMHAANAEPIPDSGGVHEIEYGQEGHAIKLWFVHFAEVSTIFFILAEDQPMNQSLTPEHLRLLRIRVAEIGEELQVPRRL